jgi:hypothetical protein
MHPPVLVCLGLCLVCLQGEALINDKINWLALFFAVYSVSTTAPTLLTNTV